VCSIKFCEASNFGIRRSGLCRRLASACQGWRIRVVRNLCVSTQAELDPNMDVAIIPSIALNRGVYHLLQLNLLKMSAADIATDGWLQSEPVGRSP
jgi:hypothetical protein